MSTPVKKSLGRNRRTMSQSDSFYYWTSEGIFIPERKLYLGSVTTDVEGGESGVDAGMARKFEIGMTALEYFNKTLPITVIMNNIGGDYYHGMAIYDRIKDSPCKVTIQAGGYVMSMGSIILQAADKRLLSRNTVVLLHYGTDGFTGPGIDFQRSAEQGKRVYANMEDIFLAQMIKKDPSMTRDKVRELLRHDTYLDAVRAIRLGLADGLTVQSKNKKTRSVAKTASDTPELPESPQS